MALAAGTRLGPFEVLALIGEGGMGQVYRARDARLERSVAIKVLPPELAADAERRARFEREARAVAALTHPHICALHDIGEHAASPGGPPLLYLVMEHLAGETLAARLAKGPLPVPQAVEIAAQIAAALDAAHRHGIVHRDLKPANVMLTKGGAKLLDFGLAKLGAAHDGGAVLGMSAMMTRAGGPATEQGTIVGTLPYMAPEQVEGKPADARTDVWAFGTVLYEMLTGTPAFAGASAASLVGAILAKEPAPVATLQPLTPPALDRLVRTCLAKDPDERVQNAHDLVLHLRWAADAVAAPAVPTTPARPWRRWLGVAAAFLAGVALAATAALSVLRPRDAAPRRVVRFSIELPAGREVLELALSPDASHLAYVGIEDGRTQSDMVTGPVVASNQPIVFVRALDQVTDRPLAGTAGATSPFFSPDGAWIGFFAGGRLKKLNLAGGEPITIANVPDGLWGLGALWTDDGTIVAASANHGLWRVPASGGTPEPVTKPDSARGELHHAWPALAPRRRTLLFSVLRGFATDAIGVDSVSLDDRSRRAVVEAGNAPYALDDGRLVLATGSALSVVGLDESRQQGVGGPVVVVDDLRFVGYRPMYALSRTGDLAYITAAAARPTSVLRVDARGREELVVSVASGLVGTVSLAPDGRRLLLTRMDRRHYMLEALDIPRGIVTRIVSGENAHAGVWSPNGERILYSANLSGADSANMFVQAADGSGEAERLVTSPQHADPGSWSADGRWMAYAQMDPSTQCDIWKLEAATRRATRFRGTNAQEVFPALAPNGRWLAYASDETGRSEVYLEAFPDGGRRVQLSSAGGTEPLWAADSRRLYFRDGSRLFGVTVSGDAAATVSAPTLVLEGRFDRGVARGPVGYAVAPDGQHFYFLRTQARAPEPMRIDVVLGWVDELQRRLGRSS